MTKPTTTERPVFQDTNRSLPDRLHDLISRLTLEEKVGMLSYPAKAVPRLADRIFGQPALDPT